MIDNVTLLLCIYQSPPINLVKRVFLLRCPSACHHSLIWVDKIPETHCLPAAWRHMIHHSGAPSPGKIWSQPGAPPAWLQTSHTHWQCTVECCSAMPDEALKNCFDGSVGGSALWYSQGGHCKIHNNILTVESVALTSRVCPTDRPWISLNQVKRNSLNREGGEKQVLVED